MQTGSLLKWFYQNFVRICQHIERYINIHLEPKVQYLYSWSELNKKVITSCKRRVMYTVDSEHVNDWKLYTSMYTVHLFRTFKLNKLHKNQHDLIKYNEGLKYCVLSNLVLRPRCCCFSNEKHTETGGLPTSNSVYG